MQKQIGYKLNYSTRFLLSIVVSFSKIHFQRKGILLKAKIEKGEGN